jgi:ATP-binding cassette, subfamily B, bacterial
MQCERYANAMRTLRERYRWRTLHPIMRGHSRRGRHLDVIEERAPSRRLGTLRAALKYLAPYRWYVVGASIALIVTASVTLSIGQGIRMVIDAGFTSGTPGMLGRSLEIFAALVGLLTLGTYARFYLVSWVGERVSADLRRAVFDHLVHLNPGFFEANLPTEIQSRVTTDTTLLQTVIGSSVSIALRNLLMFVGGVVLLFLSNPKLSSIVLVSAPVVVAPIVLFGRRVRSLSRSSQDELARVGSYVGESFRHIKIVQAFNHQSRDIQMFAEHVETAFDVAVRRIRQRAWLIALVMLLVLCAIAMMLWIGGQDVISGRTSPGELAAFIFYAFIVAGSVGSISEVVSDLQRAAGATERLMELLSATSTLIEPVDPVVLAARGPAALSFQGVDFVYPTRPTTPVLRQVSFDVSAGATVALVGPSGAGKTTLFDLAQRFYDPDAGSVCLDGVDIRRCSLHSLREQIGLVPQDPVLFAGSVLDNVRYGRPDADDAAVNAALASAGASSFVKQFPDGLATRIGEDGVGLSGGQRQRLAIARALLKRPRLLLLDEATSALDAQSEEAIRATVRALRGHTTVLIIAHRLSTVVEADCIVVLEAGSVVALGTHDELLGSSPLYREYAQIQLARFDGVGELHALGGAVSRR